MCCRRCNVFTTYDVDGTALSAPNHMSRENQGEQRAAIQLNFSDKSVPELPNSYALIHPIELGNNPVFVPRSIISQVRPSHSLVQGAKMNDELWMAHVNSVLQHDTLPEDEVITWSVYNSRLMYDDSLKPPAVIGVLPLFPDKEASPSMIKHAMQLTMQGTEFLNPGQTGVIGADQPLYAIAKQLQWTFPESVGGDKLFMMLGALHIEDNIHQMTEKLLRDSGGTTVLAQVLPSGRAQSALIEHHIKRIRYAHQLSVMYLHLLEHTAYSAYCSTGTGTAIWSCSVCSY